MDAKIKGKLIGYILLGISLVFCLIMFSLNLYYNGYFGNLKNDRKCGYNTFMDKTEQKYYVYLYQNETMDADMLHSMVGYQRSNKDKNCPLYTFEITQALEQGYLTSLNESNERIEDIVGKTNKSEVFIGNETPILLYIKKSKREDGYYENVIITFVKGTKNIDKQLAIPMYPDNILPTNNVYAGY